MKNTTQRYLAEAKPARLIQVLFIEPVFSLVFFFCPALLFIILPCVLKIKLHNFIISASSKFINSLLSSTISFILGGEFSLKGFPPVALLYKISPWNPTIDAWQCFQMTIKNVGLDIQMKISRRTKKRSNPALARSAAVPICDCASSNHGHPVLQGTPPSYLPPLIVGGRSKGNVCFFVLCAKRNTTATNSPLANEPKALQKCQSETPQQEQY